MIADYEAALPPDGWPNWVLGNHDQPRIAARVGGRRARTAAMLLLTLRGTPTMYYGDEIGRRVSQFREVWCRIHGKRMNRDWALAAILGGRRCSGMTLKARASPRRHRGCRSIKITPATMLPRSSATRVRSFVFIAGPTAPSRIEQWCYSRARGRERYSLL